jgi:hypothetical protein
MKKLTISPILEGLQENVIDPGYTDVMITK